MITELPSKEILVVQLVGYYRPADMLAIHDCIQSQIDKGNVVVLDGGQQAVGIFRGTADKMGVEIINGEYEPIAPVGWR